MRPAERTTVWSRVARASRKAPSRRQNNDTESLRAWTRVSPSATSRASIAASQLSKTSAVALRSGSLVLATSSATGRDRARVGVVGVANRVGRTLEEATRRDRGIGPRLVEEVDELRVHRARPPDRLRAELLLAVGEEVVHRPERRARRLDDLLHPCRVVALAAEQVGGGQHEALAGVAHRTTIPLVPLRLERSL